MRARRPGLEGCRARGFLGPGLIAALVAAVALACASAKGPPAPQPLAVALYPFVPAKEAYFREVADGFRRAHPEIPLELIDLSANYYDATAPNSVMETRADVLEVDTVFLADLVKAGRIRPLPSRLIPRPEKLLPVAAQASRWDGVWYGVPHWLCGNFLFFRAGDAPLAGAKDLEDLERSLKPERGLLIDLKGKTTLGELYLDSALDEGLEALPERAEAVVLSSLQRTLGLCAAGGCRSQAHHEELGHYARRFARGEARAFAGYSELLHYVAEEASRCSPAERCLEPRKVDAISLPLSERGSRPVAFADVLAIRAGCDGACLERAQAFIEYLSSDDATLSALLPPGMPVRYLLPARAALYANPRLLEAAPLYPKLKAILETSRSVQEPGLHRRMRAVGAEVDRALANP